MDFASYTLGTTIFLFSKFIVGIVCIKRFGYGVRVNCLQQGMYLTKKNLRKKKGGILLARLLLTIRCM